MFVIVLLIVASVAFGLLAPESTDEDGIQDADETGDAWYYFLVDASGSGVTALPVIPTTSIDTPQPAFWFATA